MKKNLLVWILVAALFLSSCGLLPTGTKGGLNNTTWTLVNYNESTLIPETAMTALFENGEVSGSASCNNYFGSYKTRGEQIQIDGLGWTEMACLNPEGIMEQEQVLMSILSQADKMSIQGETLQLTTANGDSLIFHYLDSEK